MSNDHRDSTLLKSLTPLCRGLRPPLPNFLLFTSVTHIFEKDLQTVPPWFQTLTKSRERVSGVVGVLSEGFICTFDLFRSEYTGVAEDGGDSRRFL